MKIAILADSAPPLSMGGVSSAHYMLCLFLQKLGHDAQLFTFHDASGNLADDPDYIHRSSNYPFVEKVIKAFCKAYFLVRDSRKLACQTSYIMGNLWGCLQVNRKVRKFAPQVVIAPDYCAPLAFMHMHKNTYVIEIEHHNPKRFTNPLHYGVSVSQRDITAALALQRKGLRQVQTVVCPSRYMQEEFTATYPGFSGEVAVFPNLVNSAYIRSIPQQSVASRLNLPAETPVVYIPSGGTAMKGERYIFSLMQMIADACRDVCFYVSGPLSVALQEEIAQHPLGKRVFAPGHTPYAENIAFAKSCSLCLSPALAENYSMALVEALTVGLPIVAFAIGGNKEIVTPSCGRLVPLLDLVEMKKAACALLDAGRHETMRASAIEHARSLEQAGQSFKELIAFIEARG